MSEQINHSLTNGTNGFTTFSQNLQQKLNESLEILTKTFRDYRTNEIFLSFNGGKDCTVLLHMVMMMCNSVTGLNNASLNCLYVKPEKSFEEVEEFVEQCEQNYNIKINRGEGRIKAVLGQICDENPALKVCIMGNRRTDPYCDKLNSFQMTDPGWPTLMRVNPLLDWTCNDIWEYILKKHVPYCSLYDQGYTSLGDKTNTIPNPNLAYTDPETGKQMYRKAFFLTDDAIERAGRL